MPADGFDQACAGNETGALLGKRGVFKPAFVTPDILVAGPHSHIDPDADDHPGRHILAPGRRIGGDPDSACAPPVQQHISGKLVGDNHLWRCQRTDGVADADHHRIQHLSGLAQRHLRTEHQRDIGDIGVLAIEDRSDLGRCARRQRLGHHILAGRNLHCGQQWRQLRFRPVIGGEIFIVEAHDSSSSSSALRRSATSISRRAMLR